MINVNWDTAADGTAVRLVTCDDAVYWAKDGYIWHNNGAHWVKCDPDCIFQTLITRPTQPKTVADAVEYYKGVWPDDTDDRIYYYFGEQTFESHCTNWGDDDKSVLVCTRAEFEAYVKEQEGEKWTHTIDGDKCYVKVSEPDFEGLL